MKKLFTLFIALSASFLAEKVKAQVYTLNTTVGSTGYDGGNNAGANGWITFAVTNNSTGDLKITEVATFSKTIHNGTTSTLWSSTTSLGGAAATLAGPTWKSEASQVVNGIATSAIYPVLTNLNVIVPAGVSMRFALATTAAEVNYSLSSTCTPNNFTAGGMTLYTGNHQYTTGNNVGYAYPNGNNPRFFTGYIKFEPAAVPCDDTLEYAVALGPKNICPNKVFSLRVGLQNGIDISGLTYQWEYSFNGVSWANFTGVPDPRNGQITDQIVKDKWYRCRVTCTATGNTFTTPAHKVSLAPFYYCYCDNAVTTTTGADIGRVNVIYQKDTLVKTGNPLPTFSNANASRLYTSYHDSISWPCLYQDSSYRFVVSQINSTASLTSTYVQGYIDFDRDGLYNPNTEKVFNKRLDGTGTPPEQITAQVKIPSTSKIGPTGMRIIMSIDSIQSAPCDTLSGEGEVEDYIVNLCYQPCDGPTNAGMVSSTDTSMCNGYEYTLTDTTYERQRSGFTRSWQISGDDRSWFDINNSTNKDTLERSFTGQPLYYRLRLICPGSDDTTFSPSTLVNIKPGYKCYCYSKAIGGKESDSSDIGGISINGFVSNSGGPHLLNATADRPRTDYTDMAEINEMYLDSTYEFSVYHTMKVQEHGDAKVTVFMDFNNNKQYDIPQERIFTGFTAIGYHTLIDNVTIPNIAITDVPTGMRFILNNNVGPNVPSDEACGPYTSGETEDFLVIFRKKVAEGIGSIGGLTGFGLYPNPSTGVVHVNFNTSVKMEELTIRVTNVTGQEVYKNTYEHKGGMFDQQIDLGSQAKGIYLVELQSGGQRLLQKLVLQ